MSVRLRVKMGISENIDTLAMTHLPIFPMTLGRHSYGALVNGFWDPLNPSIGVPVPYYHQFTTRFHTMRDSKTPVKQPPSLGGTNTPWGPGLIGYNSYLDIWPRKLRKGSVFKASCDLLEGIRIQAVHFGVAALNSLLKL